MSEEKQQPSPPSLPHRENITATQFNVLVGTFVQAANFLVAAHNDEDREGGPLDGGVVTAVETTVINICSRIDSLLTDSARWSLKGHDKLEKSVQEIYAQQARSLRVQADAYAEITSPHHRFKPQIVRMADGTWLAFAGNPKDLENAMCGVGDNPKMALEAFDALFAGQVPKHVQQWIEKNKSKLPNEKNPLDSKGTDSTENPPGKRRFHKRYSPGAGSDGAISGEQNPL